MRVLVTGAASHLARVLLPRLLAAAGVHSVIGLDLRPVAVKHPRFGYVRADIRSPDLGMHLAEVDVVIHLAFVVLQSQLGAARFDRETMRDINVGGSQNVFNLAAATGVKHLIHLSSAGIYALPARTDAIGEDHPRAPLPGFGYAEDKIAVEDWLDEFERVNPDVRVVRLRPHAILGPCAQPFLKQLLRMPLYPRLPEPAPRLQCVHEEDVVAAIRLALFNRARGAFNLATGDHTSLRELKRQLHPLALPVPVPWLRRALALGWRHWNWGTDPAWAEGLQHSLVLDTTRARTELGWVPRYGVVHTCHHALRGAAAG